MITLDINDTINSVMTKKVKEDFKISAIIPCYNEEEIIKTTYARVRDVLESNFKEYEILLIDDGSKDNTLSIIEELATRDPKVKIIAFSRNFGKEAALSAGIVHALGDFAILLDADLQDPPELVPEMLDAYLSESCNVIYGVRKKRLKESFFKKISSKVFYRVLNIFSDIDLPVDSADFKLIDKAIIDEYKRFREKNKYVRGIITWIGFRQRPFYYDRDPRIGGKTKFSTGSLIRLAITSLFYFSKKPLQIVTFLGIISLLVGFILLLYMLISHLSPHIQSASGWASILTTIIFFSGVQLVTLGIIGKYVGNIFDEVKNRPEYIVEKYINFN